MSSRMPPMRLRSILLTLCAALVFGLPAASQQPSGEPAYNVEIIVFRALKATGDAENWSIQGERQFSTAGDETLNGDTSQSAQLIRRLPASELQLTGLANRLRASGEYMPVAHAAWSQTASAWGSRTGIPIERLGIQVPGLSGVIYLERGQYLHLGMSLSYAMEDPPDGLFAGPGTIFTLKEIRRVRFYERHYYDHPAFGVIALVTPAQGGRPAGR